MRKLNSLHNPWKRGQYKGNRNYAKYQQYKRSLQNIPDIDTNNLTKQFLAKGGNITTCPDKTT